MRKGGDNHPSMSHRDPQYMTHPCGGFLSSHPARMVGDSEAVALVPSMLSLNASELLPGKVSGADGCRLGSLSLQLLPPLGMRSRGRGLRAGGSREGLRLPSMLQPPCDLP